VRLDLLLVEQGLVESREQAKRLIMAGDVLIAEQVRDKPGQLVPRDATIRVRNPLPYVSRGGLKLAGALDEFGIDVTDLTVVDVGASTGGFTDCLLQRGAARLFAIDVGYGQLAWKLRNDLRVVSLERTNIRHLAELPGGILADMAVIDASFISLALVLPATLRLLRPQAQVVALIKPQFEAGKAQVGKGGVVRETNVHRTVLEENCQLADQLGLTIRGLTLSRLLGPAGNVEFLVWYQWEQPTPAAALSSTAGELNAPHSNHAINVTATIEQLLIEAIELRKMHK
jgi:23S rRNA (cytidine1920-2'-O)/16S rRNA (cytidine1409-2'-O)-methyltransferase